MVEGEASNLAPLVKPETSRADALFATLYAHLHRIAERELRRNPRATLSPTTLLHETFLNSSVRGFAELSDRRRFMGYASRAMRGLIIDYLRRGNAQKRGGHFEFVSLPDELYESTLGDLDIDRLHEALDSLTSIDPRLAECVNLKFFCGFSFADIAHLWDVSERTVQRDWEKARVLLNRLIGGVAVG